MKILIFIWEYETHSYWCSQSTRQCMYTQAHTEKGKFFRVGNLAICCFSVAKTCLTLCNPMDCSTPDSSVLHNLLEFAQIHVHWVDDAIYLSHPLLPPSPFAFSLSQHQGLFQSFSEYSGLISFRIDWFNILAVQGILKSLLQHHYSKASIL